MADFLLANMKRKCPDQMVYEPLSDFPLLSQIKRMKNQDGELAVILEEGAEAGPQDVQLQISGDSSSSVMSSSKLSTNLIPEFDHVIHSQLFWSGNMATVAEGSSAAARNCAAVAEVPVSMAEETATRNVPAEEDAMIDDDEAAGDLMEIEEEGQRGADEHRLQQRHQTNRGASSLWSGFF